MAVADCFAPGVCGDKSSQDKDIEKAKSILNTLED